MTVVSTPIFIQAGSHPAENVRRFINAVSNDSEGIVSSSDLVVSQRGAGANMSVDVATGTCLIKGDESSYQGTYFCENRGTTNLVISAQDATNNRIDLVVAKVQDAAYSGATNAFSLAIVAGTAAASPSAPSAPNNSITLAQVLVKSTANGGGSIVTADITDTRSRATLAGGISVVTSSTRPTGSDGLAIYETDTDRLMIYDGSQWEFMGGNRPSVQAVRSSAQSISTATDTAVAFNASDTFDTDTMHSTVTNNSRITIPTNYGGRWRFDCWAEFASATTGSDRISLKVNNTTTYVLDQDKPTGVMHLAASRVLNLAAGDYVEMMVYQSSGGALNVNEANFTGTYEGRS